MPAKSSVVQDVVEEVPGADKVVGEEERGSMGLRALRRDMLRD